MRSHPPFATGPCPYEMDDGAYILGALAPAERAEFERHLAGCPPCRDSMAQLAVLPGLLGRLDPAAARPSATAPPSLLPRVLAAVRAKRAARRRRRLFALIAGVVLAVSGVTAVAVATQLDESVRIATEVAYRPMTVDAGNTRVDAEVGIQEQQTGTLVAVRCLYYGSADRTWHVWLVVFTGDDEAEPIGSWVATGGTPVEVTAVTHFAPDEIVRIELQTANNTTIAWWSP